MLSGRGLCDELITRPEESHRLWRVVVCDLETSRIGAPYIYDISSLRVKMILNCLKCAWRTYFILHLCETNRALVVTPKMMVIFCMLKHMSHQSLY